MQAVYRTRMAIKDNGTLIIMGPNVRKFGEDEEVDKLIRKCSPRSSRVCFSLALSCTAASDTATAPRLRFSSS